MDCNAENITLCYDPLESELGNPKCTLTGRTCVPSPRRRVRAPPVKLCREWYTYAVVARSNSFLSVDYVNHQQQHQQRIINVHLDTASLVTSPPNGLAASSEDETQLPPRRSRCAGCRPQCELDELVHACHACSRSSRATTHDTRRLLPSVAAVNSHFARYAQSTPPARHDKTVVTVSGAWQCELDNCY